MSTRRPAAGAGGASGGRPRGRTAAGAGRRDESARSSRDGGSTGDYPRVEVGRDWRRKVRRELDNIVLRVQGRLDSEWSDRVLPWLCAGGLFVVLAALAAAQVRSLDAPIDHAAAVQSIWLIHNGYEPIVTVTNGLHALAPEVALVLYPLSLLTYVVPVAPALVVVQSGALALAAVPLWRLCRSLVKLRAGTSLCVFAAYALNPAMHSLNLAGFHAETLALPLLLYAACFGLSSHWRRFFVCCVLVLMCRADLGLAVAGLGALVWASGRKAEGRTAVVVGVAYTFVAAFWIEPAIAGGVYPHLGEHGVFGDTPRAVLWGMVTQPADVVRALLREQNFQLLARLLAPVAFLPLLAPRYLLPAAPIAFLYLTSDSPGAVVYGEQTLALVAFVFLALVFALRTVGRTGPDRVRVDRWVLAVLLLAAAVAFGRESASSPYRTPWVWGGRDRVDHARLAAVKVVGPERSVRTSSTLAGDLAARQRVYVLPATPHPEIDATASDVDAVVLDSTTVPAWTMEDHAAFRVGLEARGFRQASNEEGIVVYLRPDPGT